MLHSILAVVSVLYVVFAIKNAKERDSKNAVLCVLVSAAAYAFM